MTPSSCHEPVQALHGGSGVPGSAPGALYDVGVTVRPGPRDRGVKREMKYLVAYDICSAKRLRRVALVCEDYGCRVQKSVFECDLEPEHFDRMWERLCAEIDEEEDFLAAYPICRGCSEKVSSAGVMTRPEKIVAYIC